MDKSYEEIDSNLKAYSMLTVIQGQIQLQPGVKRGIKTFFQWTKDMIRTDQDPVVIPIVAFNLTLLTRHYTWHATFVKKSTSLSVTAKQSDFTASTKWEDWQPMFINFLHTIPGHDVRSRKSKGS